MRRGLLLIDRGSREAEVRSELDDICERLRSTRRYDHVSYCFLEVVPPFLPEGMAGALGEGLDELTVVPYFLYPGKKLKAAVRDVMRMQAGTRTRIVVTRPMSMRRTLVEIADSRIRGALDEERLGGSASSDVDVLVIGHGSVDPNARRSLDYVTSELARSYRSAQSCFLEIEKPDIAQGIASCEAGSPEVLAIVFYFLHEGAHVKRDIYADLNPALRASSIPRAVVTRHIGADERMVRLILEQSREVETPER